MRKSISYKCHVNPFDLSSVFSAFPSELPSELRGVNLEVALQECYERMEAIGANSAELRARKILQGLGFTDFNMSGRPTSGLSGGWAMRAALAAALFVKPHLLLLDEVTN